MRTPPFLIRFALGPALGAVLALGSLVAAPARAQGINLQMRGASLAEVLDRLHVQTGYNFTLQEPGREAETGRRDIALTDASLSEALAKLAADYRCEFFSTDFDGFRVVAHRAPEGRETPVGPYRLRAGPPFQTVDPGVVQMTLMFTAPDDARAEAVAGLAPGARVLDNFGRSLLPPQSRISRTTAPRTRLVEYWHRLQLTLPDDRAVRIRAVSGELAVYRKVSLLRFEFPLRTPSGEGAPGGPSELEQQGVRIRMEGSAFAGRDFSASFRLSWKEEQEVAGRGISRKPLPYVVDESGRVHREFTPRLATVNQGGETVTEQRVSFSGLARPPVKLVYELWLKEDPTERIPFRIAGIPLPEQESARLRSERRPFHAAGGGILSFPVVDRSGRPVEGEVSVGLARKGASGYGAVRWLELIADDRGRVRLENLEPGAYRVSRIYRSSPGAPPHPERGRGIETRVAAGKETTLPPLKLPIQAPPEPE